MSGLKRTGIDEVDDAAEPAGLTSCFILLRGAWGPAADFISMILSTQFGVSAHTATTLRSLRWTDVHHRD